MNGLRVWLIVVRIESVRNCNAGTLAPGNSTIEVSKEATGHKDAAVTFHVVHFCSLACGTGRKLGHTVNAL